MSGSRRMTGRKRILFAAIAVTLTFVAALLVLLGVNAWGYRGPVAARKAPGEFRIAVFGGSTAFGYGVTWEESFPAVLERRLNAARPGGYTVVNLAYNNEGAYSFKFTMKDYEYLHYDVALLYEGYNDLMGDPTRPNFSVFRHESPIFRATGYLPIFPIVFKEKAAVMLYGGDIGALYRDQKKTVFRPGLAARTSAEALNAAAAVGQSLERQLGRVTAEPPHHIVDAAATGCKYPWQEYCRSILEAVNYSLANGKQVLVATQPYEAGADLRERHKEQQSEMAAMLARRFGGDSRVAYVNLGSVVEVSDPALSFDRMHLTAAGNATLAGALVAPVMTLASRGATAAGRAGH